MAANPSDRVVFIDSNGNPQCASSSAVVIADRKFIAALDKFSANAALAADCVAAFGGIPAPVAKAVLRSLESAQASLRSLLQASGAGSERVN